jgi:hypothetical protein
MPAAAAMPAAAIPAAVAETLKPRGRPGAALLEAVVTGAGRLRMWSMPWGLDVCPAELVDDVGLPLPLPGLPRCAGVCVCTQGVPPYPCCE